MSECNCNPCNSGLKVCIDTELLDFIEIIAEAKSADKQLLGFMVTCWIDNAEKLLAKARGEQ